uniref:AIG1-type G domain-containing protein n=1 Tax=Pseudonaja textilis TaxID=8673 RepID=A0A670ZCU7_PSETE
SPSLPPSPPPLSLSTTESIATGNTILGRKEFESAVSAKTTTLRCQRGQGSWQGRTVYVVDTPGLLDTDDYTEIMRREILACVDLSRPGPHALILVTRVGHFPAKDGVAAKCVWDIFGPESARHTVVLFTCVENLGGTPLQEYVRNAKNRDLQELIGRCGHRFCGFNNGAVGAERARQVSELMAIVRRTVIENGGRHYVNRLYLEPNLRDSIVQVFVAENRNAHKMAKKAGCPTILNAACDDPERAWHQSHPSQRSQKNPFIISNSTFRLEEKKK